MLDTAQRETLAALADVLIPASDPMPSATAAGVPGALIDLVLGFRPDLAEPFAAALAQCAGQEPEAALDALATGSPAQFQAGVIGQTALVFGAAPFSVTRDA